MPAPDVQRDSLVRRIYDINEKDFEGVALEVWNYQYAFNPLYHSYCQLLGIGPRQIRTMEDLPFLPIALFKNHEVKSGDWIPEKIFRSSGTTGSTTSRHLVRDLGFYHAITERCFPPVWHIPHTYAWIGLLPSYLERADSSLVDMVHHFMTCSGHTGNGFFPQVNNEVVHALHALQQANQPTMLIGVSFALLDLFERMDVPVWDNLCVIETGGMKGRGKEITREELYQRLRLNYKHLRIASEYGMTELMSQAYRWDLHYHPGATLRVLMRDISDPLKLIGHGQRGVINVIDLANIDTCAFIATDDLGITYTDGTFDVLGRLDDSELRGCNLMYS